MKTKIAITAFFLATALLLAMTAAAETKNSDAKAATAASSTAAVPAAAAAPVAAAATPVIPAAMSDLRYEGEKRYRANCGRCHAAPPRFSPRMMSTIVRHMRVRATLTQEDMSLILKYMTE